MNSAERKAKELIDKYFGLFKSLLPRHTNLFVLDKAKECVFIAVDEIMKPNKFGCIGVDETKFWQAVKHEIKQL